MLNLTESLSLSGEAIADLLSTTISHNASFRMRVEGGSMAPFIRNGSVLTIAGLPESKINFGRPAAFLSSADRNFIIHRIVGERRGNYLIKGDNSWQADGFIPKDEILGYVIKVELGAKTIHFGLGPERFIIAILSRYKILPLIFACWRFLPKALREQVKCRMPF